jgi:hypothetical protein
MSYPARVFRILIASPSDVEEERDIAVRVIQEWNDLNSAERQIVLLPLRWETHSAPEYGKRPQEVINRQVVDKCDILLGIFWSRIGSPTGESMSGTLEEIERVAKAGKLVMLYFSQTKLNPDDIELDQLSKLREFKKNTFPKGLIEKYSSIIEFRDKMAKQLEIQIRALLSEQNSEGGDVENRSLTTDIHIELTDPENGTRVGKQLTLSTRWLGIQRFESIPDYGEPEVEEESNPFSSFSHSSPNKDYYRERCTLLLQRNAIRPVRRWMRNDGGIGARDVYVDIQLKSKSGKFFALSADEVSSGSPSKLKGYLLTSGNFFQSPEDILKKISESWGSSFEIKALQPKREVYSRELFFIGADRNTEIEITTRTYADTLPEPYVETLAISLIVDVTPIDATALVLALQKEDKE